MGIFDRRRERDNEKMDSPLWQKAYIPSYSFITDDHGSPSAAFGLSEGIATRLLKKPREFYEETDRFTLILISATENKILGYVPYEKALKIAEKFQIDETRDEILIRPLSYTDLQEFLAAK
ncbi:MAG: hypothetical protein J6T40_10775 [Clostridiales bacterium]|nr:hypothetical protein [Clostridiales bacterium]